MRDIGRMMYKMDMVEKYGQMVVNMKDLMLWAKRKVKENTFGQMEVVIKEIGRRTI